MLGNKHPRIFASRARSKINLTHGQLAWTWHITSESMHNLCVWELKLFTKVFRMRRLRMPHLPDGIEPAQHYYQRTAHYFYEWYASSTNKMLFQRVIESIYKAGWDESKTILCNGQNPLAEAQSGTSIRWREAVRDISTAKRRAEGLVFTCAGPQNF